MMRKLIALVVLPALLLQWFPDMLHEIWHDENHAHTTDFITLEECISKAHFHCNNDQVLWMPAELHNFHSLEWIDLVQPNIYLCLVTSSVSIKPLCLGGRAPPVMS